MTFMLLSITILDVFSFSETVRSAFVKLYLNNINQTTMASQGGIIPFVMDFYNDPFKW